MGRGGSRAQLVGAGSSVGSQALPEPSCGCLLQEPLPFSSSPLPPCPVLLSMCSTLQGTFYQAACTGIDAQRRVLHCAFNKCEVGSLQCPWLAAFWASVGLASCAGLAATFAEHTPLAALYAAPEALAAAQARAPPALAPHLSPQPAPCPPPPGLHHGPRGRPLPQAGQL